MNLAYVFSQDGSICVLVGSESYTVAKGHANYIPIKAAVAARDTQEFLRLLNVATTVKVASKGKVTVENGNVLYDGEVINDVLTARMLEMIRSGYDVENFVKFLNNLMENSSFNSIHQISAFLENKCLPFTDDGCFLAYKSVRHDYLDKYSGTISNKVGCKPSMPRNLISDDPNNECDRGLHVGALHYAGPNGWYHDSSDRTMIVKVNPKNVVCVPKDHGRGKMRTCEYEVIAEYKGELNKPVYETNDELETVAVVEKQDNVDLFDGPTDINDIYEGDKLLFSYHDEPRELIVDKIDYHNETVAGATEKGYRKFYFEEMLGIRYDN